MSIQASPGATPGTQVVVMTQDIAADKVFAANRVAIAERRLYDAEGALHAAHQSGVDTWIAAASDRLHEAIVEHIAAVNALHAA
jgi:hypothetical protein